MNRKLLITMLAVTASAPRGVVAQQPADTVQLEPVVITATRVPVPRSSVPLAVTVLDGKELRARGIRHVSEALRNVPGFAVVQSGSFGGTTSLFLRGGEANSVKVLVDGVPLNQPGGAVDLANLTLDNVERVEIVRGPASVLYGSDAVAGVVQIFTRRGAGRTRGEVSVRAGTFATAAAEAGLHGGTGAVSYGFGFARSTTDGILDFNNDYDNTVWSGSVRAASEGRTDVALSLRYTDSEFHVPTDGTGRLVDRNAFSLSEQLSGALDVGHWLSDRVEGRLLLTLHEFDGGFDDRPDGPADTLGFFGFNTVQDVTRRAADGRVNLHVGEAVVTAGATFEEQKERSLSESLSQFGNSTSSLEVERLNYAYYGQLYATPVPGLAVTLGLRVDENEEFGSFFTYRGGASYQLPTGTRLRASAGRAFKEPTFLENFSTNPFFRGNPDLDPERSLSWEFGVEQTASGGRVRVAATYFDQRFRDLIQFTFAPPNPDGPHFFNVPAADASGVELEVTLAPVAGLTVGGNFTGLDTDVRDPGFDVATGDEFVRDSTLLRRPATVFGIEATYALLDHATLAASVRHVGERADRDFGSFPATRVTLEPYTDVAVSAEVDLVRGAAGPALTLRGRVDNLLDEEFQEAFGFRAPGRRVTVGISARF